MAEPDGEDGWSNPQGPIGIPGNGEPLLGPDGVEGEVGPQCPPGGTGYRFGDPPTLADLQRGYTSTVGLRDGLAALYQHFARISGNLEIMGGLDPQADEPIIVEN